MSAKSRCYDDEQKAQQNAEEAELRAAQIQDRDDVEVARDEEKQREHMELVFRFNDTQRFRVLEEGEALVQLELAEEQRIAEKMGNQLLEATQKLEDEGKRASLLSRVAEARRKRLLSIGEHLVDAEKLLTDIEIRKMDRDAVMELRQKEQELRRQSLKERLAKARAINERCEKNTTEAKLQAKEEMRIKEADRIAMEEARHADLEKDKYDAELRRISHMNCVIYEERLEAARKAEEDRDRKVKCLDRSSFESHFEIEELHNRYRVLDELSEGAKSIRMLSLCDINVDFE